MMWSADSLPSCSTYFYSSMVRRSFYLSKHKVVIFLTFTQNLTSFFIATLPSNYRHYQCVMYGNFDVDFQISRSCAKFANICYPNLEASIRLRHQLCWTFNIVFFFSFLWEVALYLWVHSCVLLKPVECNKPVCPNFRPQ